MVIEEECFDDTNLTDGATFPAVLIKCAKSRLNHFFFHVTQTNIFGKLKQTMVVTHRSYRYYVRNVMVIFF